METIKSPVPPFSAEIYKHILKKTQVLRITGKVCKVVGLIVEAKGPGVKLGELCLLTSPNTGKKVLAEVVGFHEERVILLPLEDLEGISPGCDVVALGHKLEVGVSPALIGRVLDGLGRPMDAKGRIIPEKWYPVSALPPNPLKRKRITRRLPVGIRAVDALLTCGCGQRIGIFAGSGVGKSMLLGMIARNASADVNVIALVGERGREVRDFIEKDLGEEGLKKSVVVVATSDQPALVRLKGAMVATAIAEYFRDLGKDVLLMMDSITRFAVAQREVGLAAGEPPTTRGYTPSVFSLLPKLLERSGTSHCGSITGLYTVLVEGDDFNEPISDSVRSILDGHIVLSRELAHKNHYPAIDVLASISRLMIDLADERQITIAGKIREYLSIYKESEDLINIGAYVQGSNPRIDRAIMLMPQIINFLKQGAFEKDDLESAVAKMADIVGGDL